MLSIGAVGFYFCLMGFPLIKGILNLTILGEIEAYRSYLFSIVNMWFSVSVHEQKRWNLIVNPKRRFLWEVFFFFEKRDLFSIRKLSVGACSVVIGFLPWSAFKGPWKKSQPSKVNRLRWATKCCDGKFRSGSSWNWCKSFRSSAVITLPRVEEKSRRLKAKALLSTHLSDAHRNGKNSCSRSNRVAEDIVQDRERDFNKDCYFKLNAAPGAEGRQVDVKGLEKIRSSSWLVFNCDFDHNSPAQNEGGTIKRRDAQASVRPSVWTTGSR